MKLHTLVIICYNQEKFILSALQSVYEQSEAPDEIFILDDASSDSTMQIILQFVGRFKTEVTVIKNPENLGIWANVQKARSLGSGLILSLLAGDDLLNEHAIKSINDCARENNLDNEQKFIICTDTEILWNNGIKTPWINSKEKFDNPISARVRESLSFRSLGVSRKLIENIESEHKIIHSLPEVGLLADYIKGFEEVINSEQFFYVDYIASTYRADVGIVKATDRRVLAEQKLTAMRYVQDKYGNYFSKSDLRFFKLLRAEEEVYINNFSIKSKIALLFQIVANINNFGANSNFLKITSNLLPKIVKRYLRVLRPKIYLFLRRMNEIF